MAYDRLDLETGDTLDAEVFRRIDDAIEALYINVGEVPPIEMDPLGKSDMISGGCQGTIGNKLSIWATNAYAYVMYDIGPADSFEVKTVVSESQTYQYYAFALSEDNIVLATYGESTFTRNAKIQFTIENLPENTTKICVVCYVNVGGYLEIQPRSSHMTIADYTQILRTKVDTATEGINFLQDALGAKVEKYELGSIDTSAQVSGGITGINLNAALNTTVTTYYNHLIIDIQDDANYYEVTTRMSTSSGYMYYAFALDDNNIVLEHWGESVLANQTESFVVENIPSSATKLAFLVYSPNNNTDNPLQINAYQKVAILGNIEAGTSSGGGGESVNIKNIKAQLDEKRPLIINRNSDKKFLNIVHITDTHLQEDDQSGLLEVLTANQLASEGWIDFVVHGGDVFNSYELGGSGQGVTKKEALRRIDDCLSNFKDVKCPIYVARGNHDVNGKYMPGYPDDTTVDKTQIISQTAFNMIAQRGLRGSIDAEYMCSFYKDFDYEKVRVIVLDSYPTDSQSGSATVGTMNFLANALKLDTNKRDYSVVIFCHTFESMVGQYYSPLILAFKNGESYANSYFEVDVDYSTQGPGSFIGCICGHSHAERSHIEKGYWNIQTATSYMKDGSNVANAIYTTVYTFDTDNHIIYKEKLGNGGIRAAFNWDTLTSTELTD